jgi:Type IV secretion system pilin
MKKIIIFALPLFFLLTLLPLDVATAQSTNPLGFVTCNGPDCSACNLVSMINNLIRWLFGFIFLLFSVLMIKAGFGLVTSGGSQSALDAAKSSFQNAIIGLIIVMAAWLMVDTIMRGLVGGGATGVAAGNIINGWGPWSQVQCQVQTAPGAAPAPAPGTPSTPGGTTPGGSVASGCATCTAIPSTIPLNSSPCASGYTCQIRPDMASRLTAANLATNGLRVSEAWPPTGYSTSDPTGVHASSCHGNATCVDVSFNQNTPSAAQVNGFIQNASANQLTAQYEVSTVERAQQLRNAGVTNVIVVAGINREHFSVYMCDVDGTARACR